MKLLLTSFVLTVAMFIALPASAQPLNALTGFAWDVTGNNGDNRLDEIGNQGANSILQQAHISQILIQGTDRIDYRNDNDFNNGDAGLMARAFNMAQTQADFPGLALPGLNQNDNFATGFRGFLNIPSGVATVEFGTNRADDPVQVYVDLNQDGVFTAPGGGGLAGERVVDRPCCGNQFNAGFVLPEGSYEYLAVQLERGGGSQVEPTIDLFDAGGQSLLGGRQTVQPGQMNGLFTDSLAAIPEPSSIAIWSLLGLALAGFGYRRFRTKK